MNLGFPSERDGKIRADADPGASTTTLNEPGRVEDWGGLKKGKADDRGRCGKRGRAFTQQEGTFSGRI